MYSELTEIRLSGKLGRAFGRVHHLAVGSVAEAVRALGAQYPGFDAYLTKSKDRGVAYTVFCGKRNLTEEEIKRGDPTGKETIRIIPVLMGRKNGGWLNIVLGAVLIVAGVVVSGMTFGAAGVLGGALISAGIGMMVGGVVMLLAPQPRGRGTEDDPENRPSYSFNGAVNTQAQGNPVPLVYGEVITGSAVVSAGINAQDQAYIPTSSGSSGSGGGGGGGAPPWYQEVLQ